MALDASSNPIMDEVFEVTEPAISEEQVLAFRHATSTRHAVGIPLTFITRFRRPEFQMLERLKIDFSNLLHTDQEYRYLKPFKVGESPVIKSRVRDHRERRSRQGSLQILTVETEFSSSEELKAISLTTFVVRQAAEQST